MSDVPVKGSVGPDGQIDFGPSCNRCTGSGVVYRMSDTYVDPDDGHTKLKGTVCPDCKGSGVK